MREDKGQPPGMHTKASQRLRPHPWPPQGLSVSHYSSLPLRCAGAGEGAPDQELLGVGVLFLSPQCWGGSVLPGETAGEGAGVPDRHKPLISSSHLASPRK